MPLFARAIVGDATLAQVVGGTGKVYESSYAGGVDFLQDRLLSYLTPTHTPHPSLGQVAEQLAYFPQFAMPGIWPLQAVAELAPEMGEPASVSDTLSLVRAVHVGMLIYAPSASRPDLGANYADGRMAAHRVTRAAWSAWLAGFQADTDLRAMFSGIALTVEAGDRDQTGARYYQPGTNQNTVLWLRATDVAFHL